MNEDKRETRGERAMKAVGVMLLLSGLGLTVSAFVLLSGNTARSAFVLAALVVQLLGLGALVQAHMPEEEDEK